MAQGLAEAISAVAQLSPAGGAFEFKGHWHSWQEVSALMAVLEQQLAGAGLAQGATVAILLRNRPAALAAALQVLASRRCIVTINPFQSAEKIAADLAQLRAPAVVAENQDWDNAALREAVAAIGALGIRLDSETPLRATPVPGLDRLGEGPFHPPQPDTCILMLTSGTTGPAKRIRMPYRSLEQALLDAAHYERGSGRPTALKTSAALLCTPLVHIGGLYHAVSSVVSARPLAMMEKFNIDEWRRLMVAHRPKLIMLPPAAVRMIVDADVPAEDLSSLLAIRTGSAPLEPALAERFEQRYGVPLLDTYGATEFAGAVAGWTLPDHHRFGALKRGSVGRAHAGCELRVIDPASGEPLPAGTTGLLEVKAAQIDAGRWLRTTDLAEIDADGFLFIRGRADDAIIRGGFKVLPPDVEAALKNHPAVKDACVIGQPEPRLGAVPVAAVELREGHSVTVEELLAHAQRQLVAYQVPTALKIVPALPRTPSLKVSKYEVRALFESAQ